MPNVEKVVRGLECCTNIAIKCDDKDCPYWYNDDCVSDLDKDALELLRMQVEAKTPTEIRLMHDEYIGHCPSCGRVVHFAQRYCHNCTRLLNWSEVLELPFEEDDNG